ncbi:MULTISPECIES: DUF305 domain-containing protein [unclassified Spirillospora]|uniref:DUF305 domain-containing protein n=1 Tax=unclassified Spirillospora TaxID=2642701 RepID=UPI00372027FA
MKLARLARRHPVRPEVRTLASAIEATQVAEAKRMQERLRAWRRPPRGRAHEHAAHGGMPETTDAELAALKRPPSPHVLPVTSGRGAGPRRVERAGRDGRCRPCSRRSG